MFSIDHYLADSVTKYHLARYYLLTLNLILLYKISMAYYYLLKKIT